MIEILLLRALEAREADHLGETAFNGAGYPLHTDNDSFVFDSTEEQIITRRQARQVHRKFLYTRFKCTPLLFRFFD